MTAFTIANTAKIIGREAFLDCEALASIVIPASVSEIGDRAFRGCKALSAVTFDGESALQRIGENAFQACYALTAFTIPAAVNEIGSEAFIDCDLLKSVTFECVEGWSATRDELTHAFSGSIGNAEEAANRLTQSSWPNGSGYADYRWNRVPPSDQE